MLRQSQSHLAFLLFAAFIVGVPAPAQVEPSATGNAGAALDDSEMMTPPPVSGIPYANISGSAERSNLLTASVTASPSYIDNVLPSVNSAPINEVIYSILPTLSLDRTAPRQIEQFTYGPSFNFYQPTSGAKTSIPDSIDQNASAAFQYRFSPEVTLNVQDNFSRTSIAYDSPYLFSSPVTGSTLNPTQTLIVPFAQQMINTLNGVLSYHFGLNSMVGGGGTYSTFDLPNPTDAPGLYNSDQTGGEVFYNRRLSRSQYFGLSYQYVRSLANPANELSETQTHSILPFYTVYFNRTFSFSVSAGPQRIEISEPQTASSNSWGPSGVVSMGWQGAKGNVAARYTHGVSAGEGLVGAYTLNGASASGGWNLSHSWSAEMSFAYANTSSVAAQAAPTFQGGTTLTAGLSVEHPISEHFSASFQYQHLHESYAIAAIVPDSNRESGSITYRFQKPLGK